MAHHHYLRRAASSTTAIQKCLFSSRCAVSPSSHFVVGVQTARRGFVSTTDALLEKITIKVPTMGDSITEGTIIEWKAEVGQAVKEDDVVVLIETDKVTIDIKAEFDGVITQHFGATDQEVEVDANLYEIDTEGVATVEATSTTDDSEGDALETELKETLTTASEAQSGDNATPLQVHRIPTIKFLGKDGWAALRSGAAKEQTKAALSSPLDVTVLDGSTLSPLYGRPSLSEDEMDALMMGGANIAPAVSKYSRGALFKSQD